MSTAAVDELIDDLTARRQAWDGERERKGVRFAPNFNPLDFARTDELGLSEIMRWMMAPHETHEQGTRFLEAFFETFDIDTTAADFGSPVATCEVPTHAIAAARRRIDIEIKCGGFVLAIENKPFAIFQENQIPAYCEHLEQVAPDGYAIVILKGWSNPAPAEQLATRADGTGDVVDSDYSKVVEWIQLCRERCEAGNVAAFLAAFQAHIEIHILSGVTMEEQSMILGAVGTPERQRAALDLIAAAEGMYKKLHVNFIYAVERLKVPGWLVRDDRTLRHGRYNQDYYYLTIDFAKDQPCVFIFDMASYHSEAHAGLIKRADLKHVVRRCKGIQDHLNKVLFKGYGDGSTWAWWAHQESLAAHGLLNLRERNIWKTLTEPESAAAAVVALAQRLETEMRRACG